MKFNISIVFITAFICFLHSCNSENNNNNNNNNNSKLTASIIKEDNPTIYAKGGSVTTYITSDKPWNCIILEDEANEWVTVKKEKDNGLTITTAKNATNTCRSATVKIDNTDESLDINIRQFPEIIKRTAQPKRRIKNYLELYYNNDYINRIIFILPVPQTNIYQDIENLNYYDAELLTDPNKHVSYIRKSYMYSIPNSGSTCIQEDFDIISYSITTDFEAISSLIEIDKESDIYKKYTISDGDIIVPNNPIIQNIAKTLWIEAKENIIEYSRLCYLYVSENFSYLNPNTGLHSLETILNNGGGDCGNQATVYISLLRNKGIPARHVVMARTDGTYHVRAEFYLAGYDWIPVDVNAKQFNPDGDFFGNVYSNEIVLNTDINVNIEYTSTNNYTCSLLQNYYWWYWYSSPCDIAIKHKIIEY